MAFVDGRARRARLPEQRVVGELVVRLEGEEGVSWLEEGSELGPGARRTLPAIERNQFVLVREREKKILLRVVRSTD